MNGYMHCDELILFIKINKILTLDSYGQQKKPDTEVTKENRVQEPSVVAHAVIPTHHKAEEGLLWVQGQSMPHKKILP